MSRARAWRWELRFLWELRCLPPRVALFQWRARWLAVRRGDRFSVTSATRPRDLSTLLRLARTRRSVVELGTGTAWTTISLALADPHRLVASWDPVERPERDLYLRLVPAGVRERIELVAAAGADVSAEQVTAVDALYIDSSHGFDETIREVRAWLPHLGPEAVVVFDDVAHAHYPGVRAAIAELGIEGQQVGGLFVHRVLEPGAVDDGRAAACQEPQRDRS